MAGDHHRILRRSDHAASKHRRFWLGGGVTAACCSSDVVNDHLKPDGFATTIHFRRAILYRILGSVIPYNCGDNCPFQRICHGCSRSTRTGVS